MITSRLPKEKNVQIGFTKRPFLYLLAGLFSMTCTYAAEDIEKIESCKFRLFVTKIFAWPIEDQKSWLQDHPK